MHLVQRLLPLRENKGSGSEEAHSEGFPASGSGEGAAPRLRTWCKDSRKTLFFRFPCTKSLVLFGASTLWTWCKDSRKTLFFRFLCTKFLVFFGAFPFRIWCKDSRKPLFFRFSCTKFLALFGALSLRTWCKDSRKTLFFRFPCTKIDVKSKLFRPPTSIHHMGTGAIRVHGGFFRIELTIML